MGLSLLGAALPALGSSSLPPEVAAAFSAAQVPSSAVAIVVEKLDAPGAGQRLLSQNAAQPMNPASVMKLFTTSAALDLLGPATTWRTEFRALTLPVNGVLDGPLYLKGSGDPELNMEQFWLLLRELRLKGVRDIRGNLLLDRNLFDLPPHDPAAFDGQPLRPYNAGADALLINFNALNLGLVPNETNKRIDVLLETPDAKLRIRNHLLPTPGECGDWRQKIGIKVEGSTLELSGSYPQSCGERQLDISPLTPDAQVEGLFRALWSELGGTLSGKVGRGEAPAGSLAIAAHDSPPLAEAVRDTNKFSNNVMARQLFLALSAGAPPASYEKSAARLHEWLTGKGIDAPELIIENGAGLTRNDRVSANTLAALLRTVWKSPIMPELVSSLPILGEDGTMKKRGNGKGAAGTNAKGRGHLKTGYIEGVRALAGYLLDLKGERWLLVAMVNHPNAVRAKEGLDLLVEWVINSKI
jgi:D-alanyl-D-alanine carboxypeptidase/D-alanyl-D-alanine-endopeptidase (penicillin-binding protein 4)